MNSNKKTLRNYSCGETDQQLAYLFHDHERELRTFPAGVFLFEHSSGQRVLFDTGYSTLIYDSGIHGAIYRRILSPRVRDQDNIHNQLLADNIEPSTIGYVVLSHMHPDHIGGVQYFPDAQFVMSSEAADVITSPKLKDGFLGRLLPKWFDTAQKIVLDNEQLTSDSNSLVKGYDLFSDESFLLTSLPGHARGQIGALVLDRLMLAADASWGRDLLRASSKMRKIGRIANYDMNAYQETTTRLMHIEDEGVELCFSHDTYSGSVLIP